MASTIFAHTPLHPINRLDCPETLLRQTAGLDSEDKANFEGVLTVDPNPDYDASDEIEYFFSYFPWALRGISGPGGGYPPPAYPPV
jgi:hypothetical protein